MELNISNTLLSFANCVYGILSLENISQSKDTKAKQPNNYC